MGEKAVKTINERASWALRSCELSAREIARRIGTDASWVSRLTAGETGSPDPIFLARFAKETGVSLMWLILNEGLPKATESAEMGPFDVGAAAAMLDGATVEDVDAARANIGTKPGITWPQARDEVMYHRNAREHGVSDMILDKALVDAAKALNTELQRAGLVEQKKRRG